MDKWFGDAMVQRFTHNFIYFLFEFVNASHFKFQVSSFKIQEAEFGIRNYYISLADTPMH